VHFGERDALLAGETGRQRMLLVGPLRRKTHGGHWRQPRIGAGIAQRLSAEGADVALVARTLDTKDLTPGLRETQAVCHKYGTQIAVVVADLATSRPASE